MSFNFFATNATSRRSKPHRIKHGRCAIPIALLTLAPIAQAYAADFTFDPIPVNIQGLKSLAGNKISVECAVSAAGAQQELGESSIQPSQHPREATVDADGNFSGTLGTAFNLQNPADVSKAKYYRCWLQGSKAGAVSALLVGDGSQWYHVKSGNVSVNGSIP